MTKAIIGLVLVLVIALVIVYRTQVATQLTLFMTWLSEHPVLGPFLLVIVYIIATVFFIPGSILTVGAGYAFNVAYGSIWKAVLIGGAAVWVGATIGASISMILGRFVLRDWLNTKKDKYPTIKAVQKAIETEGLKLMILIRLCPIIPFNMLNYLMGITDIKFKDYVLGSVGMVPGTVVYVFVGTTISSIAEAAKGGKGNEGTDTVLLVMAILGSILACGGIIWVSVVAKRHLKIAI